MRISICSVFSQLFEDNYCAPWYRAGRDKRDMLCVNLNMLLNEGELLTLFIVVAEEFGLSLRLHNY
jgi:hypothetical protein